MDLKGKIVETIKEHFNLDDADVEVADVKIGFRLIQTVTIDNVITDDFMLNSKPKGKRRGPKPGFKKKKKRSPRGKYKARQPFETPSNDVIPGGEKSD